ncbi:MAG: hypothetical protein QOJ55_772 [Solirubrobacteraceae bacterium]|nr:hypothetical protein [Solirubrobacteraceae bacterium]
MELLVAAIDELVGTDPRALSDSEAIIALHRELARLEAVAARATARWDADRRWAEEGARSGAAWLAARCRTPKDTARRRLRLGRALRDLPHASGAWLDGRIEGAHVSALTKARNDRTVSDLAADEAMLVENASSLRFDQFTRALAYWSQLHDPDGVEIDARRQHDERSLDLSQTFQGVWVGDFTLDPVNGAIVSDALRRSERAVFDADWADARARLGRDPLIDELTRTARQRRADALVEMAQRAMTAPADGRRPEPLFSVLVGYETFAGRVCELADGAVVTPGALVDWLDSAWVERVVFDGPSRVIDVGVQRRIFAGATRRAVIIRDRECFHDTCDEPAEDAQIDHIQPWAAGGPTTQANGRAACGFHNRDRHRRATAG